MQNDNVLLEFVSCLKSEIQLLQALIETLKQEINAFTLNSFNDLECIVSKKTMLLEQLNQCDAKRNGCLNFLGISKERRAINIWLETHCQDYPELKKSWDDLMALADKARKINSTNGLIISTYSEYNKRAFTALNFAAGNISLYGPKGQACISYGFDKSI